MAPQPSAVGTATSLAPNSSTRATQGTRLDAAINQLLKELPNQSSSTYNAEQRERHDLNRLQNIHLECRSGDTLIIVNFPAHFVNCQGVKWSSKHFCVDSAKLLATGSKVFAKLLSPKEQTRFLKAIKGAGESLEQKFVIDLTPSAEGDELAAQLIDLSLSEGVRDWWTAQERLGISPYLVSGHDDHCPRHLDVPIDCKKIDGYIPAVPKPGYMNKSLPSVDLDDIKISGSRIIDDYCPIRHRANIIRLVLAIQGYELVLNSAPRAYTLTSIANVLDCTSIIRDPVYTWFMAEPNTDFIDINPEAALKMAWALKLANITRAAFRILVVEKALDTLSPEPRANTARYTIFGRPRSDLPDDLNTVVQYAAVRFAERVKQTYEKLKSDKVYQLLDVPEYRKLILLGEIIQTAASNTSSSSFAANQQRNADLEETYRLFKELSELLIEYIAYIVRLAINSPLTLNQEKSFDLDRQCYVPRKNWISSTTIYGWLNEAQHLLIPCFWDSLAACPTNGNGKASDSKRFLNPHVQKFNAVLENAFKYILPHFPALQRWEPAWLCFDIDRFVAELSTSLYNLSKAWTKSELEAPLGRTDHLVLSLSDDEFQYLPLWAGGLDDGTGGVFEPAVPDAELGPVGPGPAYNTGNTIATDVSSICQSSATPSQVSTVTLTAEKSIAVMPSNVGSSIPSDAVPMEGIRATPASSAFATPIMSESGDTSDDDFLFDDSDEINEEAWSQVEEPLVTG
ncbi:hypothetical protein AAE478_000445 [Parahypoxylon ruwenzoriense]